jgi:hypothetical protein
LTAVSDHSGLSANRAGVLNAQSWRLIIVWLEVRVLPAPPRSPAQTGISWFSANRPELGAICARILSPQSAAWIAGTASGSLSLPWKIAFPGGGDYAEGAVKALTERGHSGNIYVLTGPQALTYFDVARLLSDAIGKLL